MIRNDLQSRTIDAMRLVLIFCVVLVHAYTATRADIDSGQYPVYRFVSFLFSLNLAQIAIPGFFFISGYLYFHNRRSYADRARRDWYRLVIPYLFWNSLMLILYYGVECIPSFSGLFSGDNLPIHQYTFTDYLRAYWDTGHSNAGNDTPILHQFWYIRNLLILGLISPIIQYYIRWTGIAGIALLLVWWVLAPGQGMIAKSVAFFAMGAWFSLNKRDFLPLIKHHVWLISILFVLTATVVMCFWGQPWAGWLNRINDIVGILFLTGLMARILSRRKTPVPLGYLRGLTFFIYATHDPLIIVVKRLLLRITGTPTDLSLTMDYFLSVFFVIIVCSVAYFILKRFTPWVMPLMIGDRPHKKSHAQ